MINNKLIIQGSSLDCTDMENSVKTVLSQEQSIQQSVELFSSQNQKDLNSKYQNASIIPSSQQKTILKICLAILFCLIVIIFTYLNRKQQKQKGFTKLYSQQLTQAMNTRQQFDKQIETLLSKIAIKVNKHALLDQTNTNFLLKISNNWEQGNEKIKKLNEKMKMLVFDQKPINNILDQRREKINQAFQDINIVQQNQNTNLDSLYEQLKKNQHNYELLNKKLMKVSNQNELLKKTLKGQYILKQSKQQSQDTISPLNQNKEQSKFPRKLWFYNDQEQQYLDYLQTLHLKNIRHYAKLSKFQFIQINFQTAKLYLQQESISKIQEIEMLLEQRGTDDEIKLQILKHITVLSILKKNGGIAIFQFLSLTEDLSWLEKIEDNWHCNKGNHVKAQVFSFFNLDYSSIKKKYNKEVTYEVEKYMVLFPSLQPFFVASVRGSQYISQLLNQYINIIKLDEQLQQYIEKQSLQNIRIESNDQKTFFQLASQLVVQKKQKIINKDINQRLKNFAIDYYGLYTINHFYFPFKIQHFFNDFVDKFFYSFIKLQMEEFQYMTGPMRYMILIHSHNQINQKLTVVTQWKQGGIMKNSFAQRLFYPENNQIFLYGNPEKPSTKNSKIKWKNLPKLIWIYWDTGLYNSLISNQLLIANIKSKVQVSGFKVIFIDDSGVKRYLDEKVIYTIKQTIKHAKVQMNPQKKSDLYRLALLSKYGGVYMDASYCLVENLDWLINIAQQPTQFIYNRFGELPKVFLFFHPMYGWSYQWTVRPQYNTKQQWQIGYESSFIAAQANNELIKQWFDQTVLYISRPYAETAKRLIDCGVSNYKWTWDTNQYLVVMDAIKCVIGRRQIALQADKKSNFADASDYYKIWSVNGFIGQQKLRQHANYQRPKFQGHLYSWRNPFAYQYSQEYVESIIGKFYHLTKFYGVNSQAITFFLDQHLENLQHQYHPKSILARHIYDKQTQELKRFYKKILLKNRI